MKKLNIAIIGGGNMGEAMIKNIKHNITVFDINKKRLNFLKKKYNVDIVETCHDMSLQKYNIIILAIKPQHIKSVYKNFKNIINKNCIIVSIIAGVSTKSISNGLGINKVVRAMPNTPALINQGITVWFSKNVSNKNKIIIQNIFQSWGSEMEVKKESFVDKATAVSGSGPAYIYYFIEKYTQAAVKLGFSKVQAQELVQQTILGSLDLLRQEKESPDELRKKVTSKKGTTEKALQVLENKKFAYLIEVAIKAAYKRSLEIKKQYE